MRAFRFIGTSELAFAGERADGLVQEWAGQWLADATCQVQAAAASAGAAPQGPWLAVEVDGQCFVRREAGVIESWVFGVAARQQPSALAREVGDAALVDLAQRLLGAGGRLRPGTAAPPPQAWQRASGAMLLALRSGAGSIELLLDARASARWLASCPRPPRAPRPTPLPLRSAIATQRLRIGASVGETEIDIGTLQSLAPGDVLPLDLRIDLPLRLKVGGHPARRGAYLGTLAGRRALILTASTDSPDAPTARSTRDIP